MHTPKFNFAGRLYANHSNSDLIHRQVTYVIMVKKNKKRVYPSLVRFGINVYTNVTELRVRVREMFYVHQCWRFTRDTNTVLLGESPCRFDLSTPSANLPVHSRSWPTCCFLLFSVFWRVCDVEHAISEKINQKTKHNRKANSSSGNGKEVNQLFLAGVLVFKRPAFTHLFWCKNGISNCKFLNATNVW